MAKQQKKWVYSPRKPAAPKVPDTVKRDVEAQANELIETTLKPRHVQPPPEEPQFNYIVDIYGKWYRHYFYFCTQYHVPGPNAISPHFEAKVARLEYTGGNNFNLAFMRHTGQWVELYQGLSLEDCLVAVRDEPFFFP